MDDHRSKYRTQFAFLFGGVGTVCTDTTALTTPTDYTTKPSPATGAIWMGEFDAVILRFLITNAAAEAVNWQATRVTDVAGSARTYQPVLAAKGVATAGTLQPSTGLISGVADSYYADQITDTLGLMGSQEFRPVDNGIAEFMIAGLGAKWIDIDVDLGTAAGVYVMYQLVKLPGGITTNDFDVTVAGSLGLFAEDTAHASGALGRMGLAVRTDTRASLAGTTGDYAPKQLTANGDVRVRDDDANTDLDTLLLILNPPVHSLLPTKTTTGAGWDEDSDEAAIPANAVSLDVHVTQDCYLFADTGTGDPATDPAIYTGGVTHRIPVAGQTKLHYKRAGANNVTLTGTVHCTA